jgi:hypothetical protein
MNITTSQSTPRRVSLSALADVQLNAQNQRLMDLAAATCRGPVPWGHRKLCEAHHVLALGQVSNRLQPEWIDLSDAMRVSLIMKVPVPCLPHPNQPIQIATNARLGLTYRREAIFAPQPGHSFINILWPPFVWHSNVAFDPRQPLCLAPKLTANLPATELLVQSFLALSLQAISLDMLDSGGVLNPAAAEFFQRRTDLVPLTREPFVMPTGEAK